MTWLRKMRPLLLVAGLAIGIGSIIGARELTGGSSSGSSAKSDAAPRSQGGPVVLGTVDTDPPPVSYGLPPVLQSGVITKVYVKDGDEVKTDQPLYEFDSTIQKRDVEQANAAVTYAKSKVDEANEQVKAHEESIKFAEEAVNAAGEKVKLAYDYYTFVDKSLEKEYKAGMKPPETWPELKKSSLDLYKAKVDYSTAKRELELAKLKLEQLKKVNPQVKVKEAEAAVEQAKAQLEKAKSAVKLCVVKAKMPGTIEQLTIGPGTTLGVSTRTPALWLIPSVPRVVRAEIEAEFAHRVGDNIKGKTVTIYDHSDPKLTYKGTVLRISNTFLLKRANAENFLGGDTRVIEAVIEVADPSPAGKPPLRVGQRVRVNLGQ